MKNPNGNAACNNAIKPTSLSIDITGIKVPKKEEHPSEYSDDNEMLGLVLNAALDAIIWIDINGDISFWNQQAEQVFGWKMSEVIGKRLSTFIIPEKYRQRHDEGMAMYVKTGKGPALNKLLELSALKRSGEEFPIELTIVPIRQGSAEFFCAFIRDITARKLTEEKIKQSSARLMEAQEIAKMGSWETDLLNLQVIWSDETFRIFDTTPHVFEASHNAFLAFVHPEDKAMVDAAFVYSLGKNIDNSIEHRIITHTGLLKFVEERWRVVRDDSGIPVRAVGTCQDITDNKNAEAAIAKVNAEKILILDSIDDGFFAIDHNAMVTYWNRRAEILIGEKREKMIGRNLHEMFARPDSMQFYDNYQKAIREKITVHFEAFSKRTNKWFAVSAFPSENGSLSVYFKDVSGSREAADKIKLSEERYNLVSKATNDMVWDWDLLTNKVYRNKEGWKKIFRTSDADMDNISTDDWDNKIHPDDLDKVILAEKEIQNPAKDLYEVECRMLRDDGTYAIINDRGQIIRNEEGIAVRLTGATQDITQRKEAELQVAKSEMRFRSLVQNSSDLISILDERGYYLYCSPALKKILGYEPESMIGKNVFAFIHPDDALFIKSNLNKNKQQSYDSLIPFRFKNENGEWQWMESKVINMTDNPEIKGYVFNTRDVTERVLAEEEIKKLSIIARETANAVIITDPEGKIVWANEAFTNISEYELEEVMGRKPGDFLQGTETNPAMVKFMHAEIEKLKAFECDILNYSKSGRKYWMRIQSQPQFDESGKLKGFFAIQTDVTREKEAEKILKASEERYRYLFQNSPASIFIWDLANFQILEVNKTAEKFYGYFREEFLTKTVFDITLTSEHLKIKQFASVALQKTSCKWEVLRTHLNKEGKEKFMSISSHCILLKGRPAILVLATDITDKTILENELENERHQKQQEITEAVISAQEQDRQQLGAELHDNINQILAGSLLYLGLAKNDLMIEHEYLNEAEKQISSAIYEIRKLSHSLIPPSLNESDLVAAIQHLISDTENSSSIKVSLYVKGFDENNMSDKLKLNIYRVIQEQFNNIHKHAEAQKVIISLEKENGKTVLSIKDDGVGFDVDQKANGVGLMNIKTRVSLFNGSMLIISSPGNGCELKAVFE